MNEDISLLIKNCCKCGELQKQTDCFLQTGKTNFIIIGESPAKDGWIVSKRAFYNVNGKLQATGRVLEKLLNNIGFTLDDIYFTECCKCIIEDRRKLNESSKNCFYILKEQLKKIPCSIILTMGQFPTQTLLQTKIKNFSDYVGKEFEIKISGKDFKLIPIYHPSPLNPKGYKENLPIFEKIKSMVYYS